MMEFMLMCCIEEKLWNALPEAERADVMRDYGAWTAELDRSGRHVNSAQLESISTATTVRKRNGKLAVTDGPFAETKEVFGGFHLVKCKDLDEAIRLASAIPTLRVGGTVEVRPVLQLFAGSVAANG